MIDHTKLLKKLLLKIAIKPILLENFLQQLKQMREILKSNLLNNIESRSLLDIVKDLKVIDGPKEYIKPLNVGLLFFNDDIEQFFPYSRIEIIDIPDPTGQGMEERIFKGPINEQLKSGLLYIKNNVIAEKVFKEENKEEAIRIKNYSFVALEEFILNAIYHRSYQIHEPITIRIEKEQIEIASFRGSDRSISDEDMKNFNIRARRYRNHRIGDFLKKLHLVEGRNTGFSTALASIKNNNSPLPI